MVNHLLPRSLTSCVCLCDGDLPKAVRRLRMVPTKPTSVDWIGSVLTDLSAFLELNGYEDHAQELDAIKERILLKSNIRSKKAH